MPNYLKPQSPLQNRNEDYFYPLTTFDQIMMDDKHLSNYPIIFDEDINITLSTFKWIKVNGQYKQSVTIDNLSEDYNVRAKLSYTGNYETDLLINENAAYIKYAKQDNNRITFYCLGSKPQVDIPIELEVGI